MHFVTENSKNIRCYLVLDNISLIFHTRNRFLWPKMIILMWLKMGNFRMHIVANDQWWPFCHYSRIVVLYVQKLRLKGIWSEMCGKLSRSSQNMVILGHFWPFLANFSPCSSKSNHQPREKFFSLIEECSMFWFLTKWNKSKT